MQKFYLPVVILLWCLGARAESYPLDCVQDVILKTEGLNCSRFVYNIDPGLPEGFSQKSVSYRLEGATKGKGEGFASGLRFNVGQTKVTYTLLLDGVFECSFIVTIVSNNVVPDLKELPTLRVSCQVKPTPPVARVECTKETIIAITSDSMGFSKPGTFRVVWRYFFYGQEVLAQPQTVIVTEAFAPDIDTLEDITGKCFAQVTTAPTGVYQCTNKKIRAITKDPLVYDRHGTFIVHWAYIDDKDTIYRQTQKVIVKETSRIIPEIDTLPVISANCTITITKYPGAKNSCTDSTIIASPLNPVRYDLPGTYTIRWRYIDKKDTLIQIQRVVVRPGRINPTIDSLPVINENCSVTITKYPTAKNSCTDSTIIASPLNPVRYDLPGLYTIRWRYIDKRDTLIQVQQVVVRAGRIIPDVDTLRAVYGNCSVTITKYPTAKSSCTDSTIIASPMNPVRYDQPGLYTIRWRYIDKRDTLIQVQLIVVRAGGILPDIDTLKPVYGNCSITITKYPTAKTGCSDSVITATPLNDLKYDQPGTYIIRWRYIDRRDTLIQTQEVIVRASKLIPELDTLPVVSGNCSVKITIFPTAKNPCTGVLIRGATSDPLAYDQPGNYSIRWQFTDKHDTLIQFQHVILRPGKLTPDSTSLPSITGSCSVKITSVPTARNNCGDKIIRATTSDPIYYDAPGIYRIRWIFIDDRDTIEQIQPVEVIAGQLIPGRDTLETITGRCSVAITDKPVARSCNGKLITATTADPLAYDSVGTYRITWVFEDQTAGMRINQSQVVIVESAGRLIPDITSLPDLTADCSVTITKIPTATNSCNGSQLVASTTDPLVYTKPGRYTIRWAYNSRNEISVVQNQTVIVNDGAVLLPEINNLPAIQSICSVVVTDIPLARNKCNGKIIKAVTMDPLIYNVAGNYQIRWLYIEGEDTLTQVQSAAVLTNGRLIADKIFLPRLSGDCEVKVDKIPTATNSCSKKVFQATTTDPLVYSIPGTYTVRWIFEDGTNVVHQSQLVIVNKKSETINVYPNPTKSEFRIKPDGCSLSQKIILRVYDILGRSIETKEHNASQEIRFGAGYPSGTYVVHVTWGEKRFLYKLIKTR